MELFSGIQPTVHTSRILTRVYVQRRHVIVLPLCRGELQQFRVKNNWLFGDVNVAGERASNPEQKTK